MAVDAGKKVKKPPPDLTAALRQQRRRQRLKRVEVLLSNERVAKLDSLLALGYAPDQQAILAKCLDETFDRLANQTREPETGYVL